MPICHYCIVLVCHMSLDYCIVFTKGRRVIKTANWIWPLLGGGNKGGTTNLNNNYRVKFRKQPLTVWLVKSFLLSAPTARRGSPVLYQMQIVPDSEATVNGLFIAVKRRDETQECSCIVILFRWSGAWEAGAAQSIRQADSSSVIETRVSSSTLL